MSHSFSSRSSDAGMPAPFPVSHSILSAAALQEEVLSCYDLGDQVRCLFLAQGVNDTYLVQTRTEQYILRVYRARLRQLSDILYEIDALIHLDRQGVPVSTPVASIDGSFVHILSAPEGPRQAVLFSYAPGEQMDRHDATNHYHHGRAVAALHNAADTFESQYVRAPLDLNYLIDQSLAAIQPLPVYSPADWEYLQNLAQRLRSQIQHIAVRGLNWGFCHGDNHILNAHSDTQHTITLFDFDYNAPGWRAYDLAIMWWCEGFYKMDPDDTLWNSFLRGYAELRSLAAADLASIPTFVAIRELWHCALIAELQPSLGFQGFPKKLQRTLRLLREWEATRIQWESA
ncbi:MAG TPA: phosphotransferase [Ktedonosporobacter sp.]|nr:phosphotransferase [Ktedonosporobacter sp.]